MKSKRVSLPRVLVGSLVALIFLSTCTIQNPPHAGKAHVGIAVPPPGSAARAVTSRSVTHAIHHHTVASHKAGSRTLVSAHKQTRAIHTRGFNKSIAPRHSASAVRPAFHHPALGVGKYTGGGPRKITAKPKDLSISNGDIQDITYYLYNVDPSQSWDYIADYVDPSDPYIDVWLTPGETYHISLNVDIGPNAPGTKVGVSKYGVEQTFTVPDDADGWSNPFWVDLYIAPTVTDVFYPEISGAGAATVKYLDQNTGNTGSANIFSASAPTASPNDRFFYGTEGNLYYLSASANKVYQWYDTSKPIDGAGGQLIFDASTDQNGTYTIYAACADTETQQTVYVLAYNSDDQTFYVIYLDLTQPDLSSYHIAAWDDQLGDLTYLNSQGILIKPTGLAIYTDLDYNAYFYVSYYGTDGQSSSEYGVSNYDWYDGTQEDYFSPPYDNFGDSIPTDTTTLAGLTIPTDVTVVDGLVYVLGSPVFSGLFDSGGNEIINKGQSDLWVLDPYYVQTYFYTYLSKPCPPSNQPVSPKLLAPSKVVGLDVSGALYFSQLQYDGQRGTIPVGWLSSVNYQLSTISNYPITQSVP